MQNLITNGLSHWAYKTFHTEFEKRIGGAPFFTATARENEAVLWEYSPLRNIGGIVTRAPISAHDWTAHFASWLLKKNLATRTTLEAMPDFRADPDAAPLFVWWLEFLEEYPQRREYWQAWRAAFPDGMKLKSQ
jgi:hypothetical protein